MSDINSLISKGPSRPTGNPFAGLDIRQILSDIVADNSNSNSSNIIKAGSISSCWRIESNRPGPHLCILGAIHGDELCGAYSICRLLKEFCEGSKTLRCGSLDLVIGNEEALSDASRDCEFNLNRLFENPQSNTSGYETKRVLELEKLFLNCDFLLDLHSTSSASTPYVICNSDSLETASSFPVSHVVVADCMMSCQFRGTTLDYSKKHGIQAVVVENGQHSDPATLTSAYQTCEFFLTHFAKDLEESGIKPLQETLVVEIFGVEAKTNAGFSYARRFSNLDRIEAGELIGKKGLEEVRAENECFIVLPTDPSIVDPGIELYFLAKEHINSKPQR